MIELISVLAAAGILYGLGIRGIRRRTSRQVVPASRVACFTLGLLVVAAALIGSLDTLSDTRFSTHMIQHVLLVLVAAPLFALATPLTVLVVSLPAGVRRHTTTPALRSRAAAFVLSPLFALAAFVIVLWSSHLPPIYDAAERNEALHNLEHLLYLLTAVLFWSAIAGLDLGRARLAFPARLLYLFLSMVAMEVLGLALSGTNHALYPYYESQARGAGVSAVADQHTGGVIMWLSGMLVTVPAMALVVLAWMAEDERRTVREQNRRDLRIATGAVEHADG